MKKIMQTFVTCEDFAKGKILLSTQANLAFCISHNATVTLYFIELMNCEDAYFTEHSIYQMT